MSQFEWVSSFLGLSGLVAVLIQLHLLRRSHLADHERRRKQSTIEYINNLRQVYQPIAKALLHKYGEDKVLNIDEIEAEDTQSVRDYLSTVEHLAAGVNCGVFDLRIIEKMSGSYFTDMFDRFKPYILHRRATKRNDRLYCEFENMCNDIVRIRDKRDPHADMKYSPRA